MGYIGYDTTKLLAADIASALRTLSADNDAEQYDNALGALSRALDILNSRLHARDREVA